MSSHDLRTTPPRGIYVRLSEAEYDLVRAAARIRRAVSPTAFARECVLARSAKTYQRYSEKKRQRNREN